MQHTFSVDVFFSNIPVSGKRYSHKLGFLKNLKKKSFLFKNLNNPFFIYTGNRRIKKLEGLRLRPKVLSKIKKKTIYIFLYEPLCFRINDDYNCSFYSEFSLDIDHYNNVTSEELESIRIFIKKNNIVDAKIFTVDYNIKKLSKFYPDLDLNYFDIFIYHRILTIESSTLKNSIKKKFWCGNWRYTLHRHLIMCFLIRYEGNYSWNFSADYQSIKENNWFDFENFKLIDNKKFNFLTDGLEKLKNKSVNIDIEDLPVIVDSCNNVYYPSRTHFTENRLKFLDSYKECFCAVVNETRFAQPFGNFSEKTLDAIMSRLPFVLVAPPKTLESLKNLGIKTFDKWWDESYDCEEDHTVRLSKIFDVIESIGQKSLSDLNTIYSEMSEILDQNIEVIKKIPSREILL